MIKSGISFEFIYNIYYISLCINVLYCMNDYMITSMSESSFCTVFQIAPLWIAHPIIHCNWSPIAKPSIKLQNMAAKNKTWKWSRNSNWAWLLKSKPTSLSPQLCRIRVYCVISIAGKDLPNEHPMADLLQSDFLLSPLALPWGPPLMPPILRRRPLPAMDDCQSFARSSQKQYSKLDVWCVFNS